MKGLSIEIRVGLLILAAAVVLAGFTFLLSGVQFGHKYIVYADFDNPGSVQPGAPVRIAGMKVGAVEGVEYLGGKLDPQTGRRALIRMKLEIDDKVKDTVHTNALFYVTAQGVLGEQFIAIDPGTVDKPILREGAIVHGVDPPRLDLALALGYELLETFTSAIRNNREELAAMLTNLGDIVRSLRDVLVNNRERVDRIIANIETATEDASTLARSIKSRVDGPQVDRIMANLDKTTTAISRDIGPILEDLRTTADGASALMNPEQRTKIQTAIDNISQLTERANATVADAQTIVGHIKAGEGSVGAMLMDEEMYDDLQEMIRDLKHNPWKFFWRE